MTCLIVVQTCVVPTSGKQHAFKFHLPLKVNLTENLFGVVIFSEVDLFQYLDGSDVRIWLDCNDRSFCNPLTHSEGVFDSLTVL